MRFEFTHQFLKEYRRLPERIKEKTKETLNRYAENPAHPSLGLKKMATGEEVFELRITISYRITFFRSSEAVVLRHIGTHDILRKEA